MTVELGFGIPIISVGVNLDSKAQRLGLRIPPAKSNRFLESGSPYMDALGRANTRAKITIALSSSICVRNPGSSLVELYV